MTLSISGILLLVAIGVIIGGTAVLIIMTSGPVRRYYHYD